MQPGVLHISQHLGQLPQILVCTVQQAEPNAAADADKADMVCVLVAGLQTVAQARVESVQGPGRGVSLDARVLPDHKQRNAEAGSQLTLPVPAGACPALHFLSA